jgi:hypothetical protein
MVDGIVKVAGISLNMALEAAANEPQPANRIFSPQNWIKTKGCLSGINGAVRNYFKHAADDARWGGDKEEA